MTTLPARTCKTALWPALLLGASLALAPLQGLAQASPEELRLRPAEAYRVAHQALQQGQPRLAAELAQGLLRRDGSDHRAHFLMALALQHLRRPEAGSRAARLAFRHAETTPDKFRAAQLAARLAVEAKRPTRAQIWLRRSLLHLPDPRLRPRVIEDFRILRRLSPWQFQAQFSLAPSNNLNNGAETPYSLIDGVPVFGVLSGSAQALSGVRSTANLSFSYRLQQSKRHASYLSLRYYAQRVALSDDARQQAPGLTNADLAFDFVELGLSQSRKAAGNGHWSFGLHLAQSWSGGDPYQRFRRLSLGRSLNLGEAGKLTLNGRLERQLGASTDSRTDVVQLDASYRYRTAAGGQLRLHFGGKMAEGNRGNSNQQRLSGQIGWQPATKLGSVATEFALGGSHQRYPDYSIGIIAVPGGREDHSLFGNVKFTFDKLDYAGFVPSVRVEARRTRSNVSRFDTRETTVSFGFESSF